MVAVLVDAATTGVVCLGEITGILVSDLADATSDLTTQSF